MNLFEELKKDMIDAMKAKDKDRLTVIRMLKAALDKERIDKKIEITDEVFISVLEKQVKMRNDSIEEFEKAGRDDLVNSYKSEIDILEEYMPKKLSEDEINEILDLGISESGASSVRDLGSVMRIVTPKVKNRCDMKVVTGMLRDKLSK